MYFADEKFNPCLKVRKRQRMSNVGCREVDRNWGWGEWSKPAALVERGRFVRVLGVGAADGRGGGDEIHALLREVGGGGHSSVFPGMGS